MAQADDQRTNRAAADRSMADLMRQLSEQTSTLVRQELELARAELTDKGKQAGIGIGMFGAAGIVALFAVGGLTATLILLLSKAVDPWVAALIVTAVYGAIAGLLALTGRSRVQRGVPPVPEHTVETVKEDVKTTKRRAMEGRR
ncbi:MAG TPA: phage holin family protein [Solirubrobacteraceae bacterium]|jgi:uncharacterized membrane protein YqjE